MTKWADVEHVRVAAKQHAADLLSTLQGEHITHAALKELADFAAMFIYVAASKGMSEEATTELVQGRLDKFAEKLHLPALRESEAGGN